EIAGDFAGLRPNCQHAGCVQAVELGPRPWIVRLVIADAPVDEIELRIVRAGSPRRSAALLPPVALGPGLRPRFATRGNRVAAPQFLAGFRVPTVEEATCRGLAAGHSRNDDAVGHNRRARGEIAFLGFGKLLVPDLLARLHVERDEMVVD